MKRKQTGIRGWHLLVVGLGAALAGGNASQEAEEPVRVGQAVARVQADLETSLENLRALRERIDREREPLRAEHRQLSQAVHQKRDRLQRLREASRLGDEQRQRLEREVSNLEDEIQFIQTAVSEYRRGMETRVSAAEPQALQPMLERLATLPVAATAPEGVAQGVEALLDNAVSWNRQRFGGYRFAGRALDSAGLERQGRFLVLGPLAWFSDEDQEAAVVTWTPGSIMPSLFPAHPEGEKREIMALVDGMHVKVPVDVSGGAALRREEAAVGLVTQIRQGGFVMIPLLLVGVLSLIISLWKIIKLHQLREASTASLGIVISEVQKGDFTAAAEAALQLHPPLSILVGEALEHRQAAREHLEEILHERILSMTPRWESHLGTLAVFGGVAPLLGLLGTVTGMIHTFELVTLFGTGEARLLSGGISEALITTKFGLAIAIPVLVVHAFLVRRVRAIISTLEGALVRFLNVLSGERAP